MAAPFSMAQGQVGCVVLINGEAVELDCVSSPDVLRGLYAKLIRSYALEAILAPEVLSFYRGVSEAKRLLADCGECEDIRFDGVGLGMEHRYRGLYEGQLIHAVMHRRTSAITRRPFPGPTGCCPDTCWQATTREISRKKRVMVFHSTRDLSPQ